MLVVTMGNRNQTVTFHTTALAVEKFTVETESKIPNCNPYLDQKKDQSSWIMLMKGVSKTTIA